MTSCRQTNTSASTTLPSRVSPKDSLTIDSLTHLATISDSLNELQKSIKYYSEILDIDSIKLIALINRGRALIALGNIQKGITDYNKAVKHYPHEETYCTRGMAYAMINDYKNAFPDFAAAATINPKFGKAYYGYSLVKINDQQYNFALSWCNKADSLSYIPGLSHSIRVEIALKQKKYDVAILEISELIKLNPNDAANYNNRGLTKNKIGNYADAINDFDISIKLDPNGAYAFNNKSYSLFKLKQYDKALSYVEQSLIIKNDNPFALKNRAEIFLAMHQTDKACTDLKSASNLSADKELADEILKLIKINCK